MTANVEGSPSHQSELGKIIWVPLVPIIVAGMLYFAKDGSSSTKINPHRSNPNPTPPSTISVPPRPDSSAELEPYQLQPDQAELVKNILNKLLESSFQDWKNGVAIAQIAQELSQTIGREKLIQQILFLSQTIREYLQGDVILNDQILLELFINLTQDPQQLDSLNKFIDELFDYLMIQS